MTHPGEPGGWLPAEAMTPARCALREKNTTGLPWGGEGYLQTLTDSVAALAQ